MQHCVRKLRFKKINDFTSFTWWTMNHVRARVLKCWIEILQFFVCGMKISQKKTSNWNWKISQWQNVRENKLKKKRKSIRKRFLFSLSLMLQEDRLDRWKENHNWKRKRNRSLVSKQWINESNYDEKDQKKTRYLIFGMKRNKLSSR